MCGRVNPNHNCLLHPDDLVNRRVSVRWFTGDNQDEPHWYEATVTAYNTKTRKHTLHYEEDDNRMEDVLADRFWRFVQNVIEVID